jgi:hypothetical protein
MALHSNESVDSEIDSSILSEIELLSLILIKCSATRAEAGDLTPGAVNAQLNIQHGQVESALTYFVEGVYNFKNALDETLADISLTYQATYHVPSGRVVSEPERERFADSVALQVTPFQREFLANMTNRLAMPAFYLPLVRLSQLEELRESE